MDDFRRGMRAWGRQNQVCLTAKMIDEMAEAIVQVGRKPAWRRGADMIVVLVGGAFCLAIGEQLYRAVLHAWLGVAK